MSNITLNLVVLRSPDVARAAAFYSRLGCSFHSSGTAADQSTLQPSFPVACSSFILFPLTGHPHLALASVFEFHLLMLRLRP